VAQEEVQLVAVPRHGRVWLVCMAVAVSSVGIAACIRTAPPRRPVQVEIAPGEWLQLDLRSTVFVADLMPRRSELQAMTARERRRLRHENPPPSGPPRAVLTWNGRQVEWRGPEVILSLRRYGDSLYMIGLNRERLPRTRFVFFGLDSKGQRFEEIPTARFPRSIATQNMWFFLRARYVNVAGHIVDDWERARTLDIEARGFASCWTARIWAQLETGDPLAADSYVSQDFLREYVRKHKPIPLTTIIKEQKAAPSSNNPQRSPEEL
jgi:hypothetical protein